MADIPNPLPAEPSQDTVGRMSWHTVEMSDCLPPWSEAGWQERARIALYTVLVYVPVAILFGVIAGTYPFYVGLFIWPMVFGGDDRPELYYWHSHSERSHCRVVGSICLTFSSLFLILFVISFYKAFTTSPGLVPDAPEWRDLRIAEEYQQQHLTERKHTNGALRWCRRCSLVKPDRSHHCRLCDQCVLKMDHHCPWIANCVGFFNYKYFFLMVTYGMLSLWLFEATFWETAVITWRDDERGPAFSFIITVVFFLLGILMSAVTLFWFFHMYLISGALTTIEYCEKGKKLRNRRYDKSPYFLSVIDAFKGALGNDPFLWFLPFKYRSEDEKGVYFQKQEEYSDAGSSKEALRQP